MTSGRLVVGLVLGAGGGAWFAVAAQADGRASSSAEFQLPPDLEAGVVAHRRLVAAAGRSTDDLCRLVADTILILPRLERALIDFQGGQGGPPYAAVERAYTETQKRVPGVFLVATEEFLRTGISFRDLGRLGPPEARPLLLGMDKLEIGADGIASWTTSVTDYSACYAPERASAPLAALVDAWSAAPACVRDSLRSRLNDDLGDMARVDCFCGKREAAVAAVRKNAGLMRKLTGTRGPELAHPFVEGALGPKARFSCHPS